MPLATFFACADSSIVAYFVRRDPDLIPQSHARNSQTHEIHAGLKSRQGPEARLRIESTEKNTISGGSGENLTTAEAEGGEPPPPASPTSLSPPAAQADIIAAFLASTDSNATSSLAATREASASKPKGEPGAAAGEEEQLEDARAGAKACERWGARENAEA